MLLYYALYKRPMREAIVKTFYRGILQKLSTQNLERYRYVIAISALILSTIVLLPERNHLDKGQWALMYLLLVILVAGLGGVKPALITAILSFFAWNLLFTPPFHTLEIEDPKDWFCLIIFIFVALLMGLQTGRLKDREAQARAREKETSLLNRFSAHIISDITIEDMKATLLEEVAAIADTEKVALCLPGEKSSPGGLGSPADHDTIRTMVEWVQTSRKAIGLPADLHTGADDANIWPLSVKSSEAGFTRESKVLLLPIQTASFQSGVLYIGARDDGLSHSTSEAHLFVALAYQAAAFLERIHLQSLAVQADALLEADRLKSTLLSSVSHELKTPLASITATVTNILEGDMEWSSEQVRTELAALKDDFHRLNRSIGSLVDLSRLEGSAWEPRKEYFEFGEIIGTALSMIPQRLQGRISFSLGDDLPLIKVDFMQWARVVQNLMENALAYSGGDTPVRVGADLGSSEVIMWVEDEGPGIPEKERERIFDKFFRGSTSAGVTSGTGLGLAITREIVRYHGGTIHAETLEPHGARFVIKLPLEA
jgi:two-component system, OmpR family, sensor histidine kinase KdpD